MKKILKIVLLFFISVNVLFSENKNLLTQEQMQEMVKTAMIVDLINYEFEMFRKDELKDESNEILINDLKYKYYALLEDCKNQYNIRLKVFNDNNFWSDKFIVYNGSYFERTIGNILIQNSVTINLFVAVTYYGKIFYLRNTGKNDFNQLINEKIYPVNNANDAIKIGLFYLSIKNVNSCYTVKVIDDSLFNKYKGRFSNIKMPTCKSLDNNEYELKINTINALEYDSAEDRILDGEIITNIIKIHTDGSIEHSQVEND